MIVASACLHGPSLDVHVPGLISTSLGSTGARRTSETSLLNGSALRPWKDRAQSCRPTPAPLGWFAIAASKGGPFEAGGASTSSVASALPDEDEEDVEVLLLEGPARSHRPPDADPADDVAKQAARGTSRPGRTDCVARESAVRSIFDGEDW